MLNWQQGNAKLPARTIHFSLPSGHTCCGADQCLSKADRVTGKISDGADTKFRCWAASQEARSPALRKKRWSNLLQLRSAKTVNRMYELLHESLMPLIDEYQKNHNQLPWIRHGVGGDFFNNRYFEAWLKLCGKVEPTTVYAYTKALPYWVKALPVPSNLVLNASIGGKWDHIAIELALKSAHVVYSIEEANNKNLELDHDDSHARVHGPSFALLLHGTQPAGSDASAALQLLKKQQGWVGYGKTHNTSIENISKACA